MPRHATETHTRHAEGTRGGVTAETRRWCAGKPDDACGKPPFKSSISMSVINGGSLLLDAYGADVAEVGPLLMLTLMHPTR